MIKKFFRLLRIHHWTKNFFVLLGVIYSQQFNFFLPALLATLSFCFISSSVYIYNDIQDLEEDRLHPHKSSRPLANNEISFVTAYFLFFICLLIGLTIGLFVSYELLAILFAYLLINFLYNWWLRKLFLLDVLCIAIGFMLRILAGTVGIHLPVTVWLTITGTILSLYIALCKRYLELRLHIANSRPSLKKYNASILKLLIQTMAFTCFIAYFFYILSTRREFVFFFLTLPFCALGLWRFSFLTLKGYKEDDPVILFLSDQVSCVNLSCFLLLTMIALLLK